MAGNVGNIVTRSPLNPSYGAGTVGGLLTQQLKDTDISQLSSPNLVPKPQSSGVDWGGLGNYYKGLVSAPFKAIGAVGNAVVHPLQTLQDAGSELSYLTGIGQSKTATPTPNQSTSISGVADRTKPSPTMSTLPPPNTSANTGTNTGLNTGAINPPDYSKTPAVNTTQTGQSSYSVPGQNLSFAIPNVGQVWRDPNDPQGNNIWARQGNSVSGLDISALGQQYLKQLGGQVVPSGASSGPTYVLKLPDGRTMAAGNASYKTLGLEALKNAGIDYNSIGMGNFNQADLQSARNLTIDTGGGLTTQQLKSLIGGAQNTESITQGVNPTNANAYTLSGGTGGTGTTTSNGTLPSTDALLAQYKAGGPLTTSQITGNPQDVGGSAYTPPAGGGVINPPTNTGTAGVISTATPTPYKTDLTTGGASPTFAGTIGAANNASMGNEALKQRAADIANQARQQISDVGQRAAAAAVGYGSTGTQPVGGGSAAAEYNTGSARMQAIAAGANMQLSGNTQGLTAQQQEQQGLTANAGLIKPYQQGYVLIDPQTGQPVGGQGSAGSAAFQGGYTGGQEAAGGTAATMQAAFGASKGVKATLDNFISQNPNINANTLTAGNTLQQWLQGQQLGDPNVQTFLNDISEYVQTLAPILGIGGTPTDAKAYTASQFVNAKASEQSVQQVISNIETLAGNKLNAFISAGSGGQTPAFTSQTSTPTGSSGTSETGFSTW